MYFVGHFSPIFHPLRFATMSLLVKDYPRALMDESGMVRNCNIVNQQYLVISLRKGRTFIAFENPSP
jgi:hypothetical protein